MPIYVKADKVKSDHTYTQFPITINDNTDSAVPEWGLFGNGSQSGTPSPDNIIMPTFCGVRTANLFDYTRTDGITDNYYINQQGQTVASVNYYISYAINVKPNEKYVWRFNADATNALHTAPSVAFYDNGGELLGAASHASSVKFFSFTTPSDCTSIKCSVYKRVKAPSEAMLNLGSTALPYEPYGWAEKITCAGQTTPVYLGQTQTVRRVRKLVFDGTEAWTYYYSQNHHTVFVSLSTIGIDSSSVSPYVMCSHYRAMYANIDLICRIIDNGTQLRFTDDVRAVDVTTWKSYLSAQYAAGTPVTVWYVLSTPETAIVNEPLAKIGAYADELHSSDAGVTLSLQTGTNTISIDSPLQPSKMNIQYYSEGYTDVKKIPMSGDREVKHVLDANGLYVYKSPNYYNWQNIRDIVRAGKGEAYYPVGSIIYDNFDSATGTAFQVVAHDHHFDPTLTAQGYTHSMTLCEVALTDVITFDAEEAFIYTDTVMPAGTYKFKIPNYESAYGGNKTYYFTSTADLPAGSQIVMTWAYHQPPASVTAYSGATPWNSTTAVTGFNALPLTEWDESVTATDLGTIAGAKTELGHSDFGTMNHIHRARYGSNNYLQSGLRQYINSDGAANAWWQAQTMFDRPYESRSSAGKLTKLNAGMVAVMAKPEIQSRTNSYFETTSFDGTTFTLSTNYTITTDKMFLLSPKELNIKTADKTVGSVLDYYINAGNEERIKYRKSDGSAYFWWLRTPNPSYAHQIRLVEMSGALNSYSAYAIDGVASACVIQ